jgi:hypothetical protein
MRVTAWALVVGLVGLGGCGEKQPPRVERVLEVWTSGAPPEPELTIEEQREKLEKERENQPEPELDANDPREKHELVWKEGKSALKGIYEERFNVLTQMKGVGFDAKVEEQKKRFLRLVDKIEGYGIGQKPDELETAASRFCALVSELRSEADALGAEGEAKLKEVDQAIAELEAKQKEGKPVTTRQYEKLEAERKLWSAPVLGARYVYMAMRTLFEEAYVLADLGARRSQLTLRDCLAKPDAKPVPYELAEEARVKLLKRSKYYLP